MTSSSSSALMNESGLLVGGDLDGQLSTMNNKKSSSSSSTFDFIFAIEVDGVQTDILFHKFANKIYLCITQYEKINNIFMVSNANALTTGVKQKNALFIEHKFGKTTDEIESAINYIITNVPQICDSQSDIIVTLGLYTIDRAILKAIVNALTHHILNNK